MSRNREGYRSDRSYQGNTIEARERSEANLAHGRGATRQPHEVITKAQLEQMNIVQFAHQVLKVDFNERPAQRILLKAIYGIPMTRLEMTLYGKITGGDINYDKQHGKKQEATEVVEVLGARSGKSMLSSIIALYETTCRGHTWRKYLDRGETGYAVIVCTKQYQAEAIIQKNCARMLLVNLGSRWFDGGPTQSELRLKNGLTILSLPCNSTAGRGLPIVLLILDELAHFYVEGPKADKTIYNALSPRLAQFPGAKTIFTSTAAAKQGLLWEWFEEGFRVPGRATFQADTLTMNPLVDRDYLERQKRQDPDNYAREYEAKFAERVAAFFPSDKLAMSFVLAGDVPPRADESYYCGIDQSGLSGRDRFSMGIAHEEGDGTVILDVVRSWDMDIMQSEGGEDTEVDKALGEIVRLLGCYETEEVSVDHYALGWVKRALQKAYRELYPGSSLGVIVRPGLSQIYANFKGLVVAGKMKLPEQEGLKDGLVKTQAYYGRNNALSIAHERSVHGHGDEADAAVTAVWKATQADDTGKSDWWVW